LVGGGGGGGGPPGFFFIFPLFATCSLQVLDVFPMHSPRVFPIAPHFNPQSPPPSHLYRWAKGGDIAISIESSILGSLPSFNFFFNGPIKFAH
jgi:hypothetical protein